MNLWSFWITASLTVAILDAAELRIAITPLSAQATGPGAAPAGIAGVFEDQLTAVLSSQPDFALLERSALTAAIAEQQLGASGLIDPQTAARIGALIRADLLLIGMTRSLGNGSALVTIRAVRCSDARVLWAADCAGTPAECVAQASSLALEGAGAMRQAVRAADPDGERHDLGALAHHERAAAMRARGAHGEAAAAELQALAIDPTLDVAYLGWLESLSAVAPGLAQAEGRDWLAQHPQAAAQHPHRRAAEKAAALRVPEITPNLPADSCEAQARRALITWLAERQTSVPAEAKALLADEATAWDALAEHYAAVSRDFSARAAMAEAATRRKRLRGEQQSSAFQASNATLRGDTPAYLVLRQLGDMRKSTSPLTPAPSLEQCLALLLPTLRVALTAAPEKDLPQPPFIAELALPISDRALVSDRWEASRLAFIFRPDWTKVPEGQIAWVKISGESQETRLVALQQPWIGRESTTFRAHGDTPWLEWPEALLDFDNGIGLAFNRDRRTTGFGFALLLTATGKNPRQDPEVRIGLHVGKSEGLVPDERTRLSLVAWHLLKGERKAALVHLGQLKRDGRSLSDWEALCAER